MNTNFTQNDTTSKNNNNKPIEKPKRKQVKNACGKCVLLNIKLKSNVYSSQLSKGLQEM